MIQKVDNHQVQTVCWIDTSQKRSQLQLENKIQQDAVKSVQIKGRKNKRMSFRISNTSPSLSFTFMIKMCNRIWMTEFQTFTYILPLYFLRDFFEEKEKILHTGYWLKSISSQGKNMCKWPSVEYVNSAYHSKGTRNYWT